MSSWRWKSRARRQPVRRAVVQLFGGNVLSKALGAGREIVLGALYGTGSIVGAFRVAQTGTLVPVNFFTSDSLNSAFIPLYRRYLTESDQKAKSLLWALIGLFGSLSLLLSLGIFFYANTWTALLAPGLGPQTSGIATAMLRVMGLGVPAYLLGSLMIFLAMAHEDFVPMAARPSVQNMGMVTAALVAYVTHDPIWFAWGFTATYAAFFVWVVSRNGRAARLVLPHRSRVTRSEVLETFWKTLRPLVLLPFLLQGNIAVERAVASLISLSAVSALDYAKFLSETVIFLLAMPFAFVGLSSWSNRDSSELRSSLGELSGLLLTLSVPISIFLLTQANLVIRMLYSRGAFDETSVQVTGRILLGLSIGLWAQVVGFVLLRALSAQLRNREVLVLMTGALGANILVNLVFHGFLGPLALGLGNSAYGLVLFVGTVWLLGIWRDVVSPLFWTAVGAIGYVFLAEALPSSGPVMYRFVEALGVTLAYWLAWIMAWPGLRDPVVRLLRSGNLR